jgi:hypothetical protein
MVRARDAVCTQLQRTKFQAWLAEVLLAVLDRLDTVPSARVSTYGRVRLEAPAPPALAAQIQGGSPLVEMWFRNDGGVLITFSEVVFAPEFKEWTVDLLTCPEFVVGPVSSNTLCAEFIMRPVAPGTCTDPEVVFDHKYCEMQDIVALPSHQGARSPVLSKLIAVWTRVRSDTARNRAVFQRWMLEVLTKTLSPGGPDGGPSLGLDPENGECQLALVVEGIEAPAPASFAGHPVQGTIEFLRDESIRLHLEVCGDLYCPDVFYDVNAGWFGHVLCLPGRYVFVETVKYPRTGFRATVLAKDWHMPASRHAAVLPKETACRGTTSALAAARDHVTALQVAERGMFLDWIGEVVAATVAGLDADLAAFVNKDTGSFSVPLLLGAPVSEPPPALAQAMRRVRKPSLELSTLTIDAAGRAVVRLCGGDIPARFADMWWDPVPCRE